MRILINNEKHKTNNFINYLIENHYEKGKKYKFNLYINDKYDKRLVDKRYNELNGNVLVHHEDGFDVFSEKVLADFEQFKLEVLGLSFNEELKKSINKDNYIKEIVKYKLDFFESEKYLTIDFQYVKLLS